MSATAHWGAGDLFCEKLSASGGRDLWVGKDKHGNYANLAACSSCSGSDQCDWQGNTSFNHAFFNVGEPGSRALIDSLGTVNGNWWDQFVWTDPDNRFIHAGSIRDQMFITRYYVLTQPPEADACYASCGDNLNSCLSACGASDTCQESCYTTNAQCSGSCTAFYRWDPQ